jgi:phage terminase large subunit-like protein
VTLPAITEDEAAATMRYAVRNAGILDSVPMMSPLYQRPSHMEKLARILRRMHKAARGEGPPVLACLSAPPQVGKSETVQHALAWWLARNPEDFLGYVSYGADLAEDKSRRIRELSTSIGVELKQGTTAVDLWRTTAGGGLIAKGLDGSITGRSALRAIVVDDPYKNRVQTESKHYRRRVRGGFDMNILSRRHPQTSILVMHTRFHVDDLIGDLSSTQGYERHVIQAIGDDGSPLWPESGRDLAYWAEMRRPNEHNWWSLYMGEPRPPSGRLFSGVHYYDALPGHYAVTIGVDLAYSSRTSADYSVAVALAYDASRDTYFVLDVLRVQESAPNFADRLKQWKTRWPGARLHAYLGGTELGVADFFRDRGIRLAVEPARADKLTRSQPTSAAWNEGRISVPGKARDDGTVISPEWVEPFVAELMDASGTNDEHDDQMDALAAAFDSAPRASYAVLRQPGALPKAYEGAVSAPVTAPRWRPGMGPLPKPY